MNDETEMTVDTLPALQPKPGGLGILRMRDYQTEAVDCIYEAWQEHQAILVTLPTGMGKTVVAAETIIRWPGVGRILFIAHVQELIYQAQETIARHTDDPPSIEMGLHRDGETEAIGRSRVLVASIQSMHRRSHKFSAADFDMLIIDEFHHAAGKTYRALWEWAKRGNPDVKLLGITATPDRADRLSLACIAEHCAYSLGIREGIDDGWLVPIQQKYIVVDGLDFSKCRTLAADLNEKDLEATMLGGEVESDGMSEEERLALIEKQERMMHAVAAPAVQEAQGRSGIVYCVTVNHATRMAEIFRRYPGVTAQVIHGETPKGDRAELVGQFKSGQLQFLVNVGIATEGFDVPNAHLIVMARPTKSRSLYTQMIGRGTRPVAGLVDKFPNPEMRQEAIANSLKPAMVVLDFCGNSGRHKLISTADVLAGDMPEEFVDAAKTEMANTGIAEDIRKASWRKKLEHDKELAERAAEEKRREAQRQAEIQAREEARRARLRAEADYRTKEVNPFDRTDTVPQRAQPSFRGGSTDAQIRLLKQLGVKEETSIRWGKGQAGAVISELKAKAGGEWIMRFGKHQGKSLKAIPHDYLRWASGEVQSEDFQYNLELFRRELGISKSQWQPGEDG